MGTKRGKKGNDGAIETSCFGMLGNTKNIFGKSMFSKDWKFACY
jgi:hypothetical protein